MDSINLFCPATFENLCWPQTRANENVTVSCAPLAMQGVDSTKFVTRSCLASGQWGAVSYQTCVYADVWDLMTKFYISKTPQQRKAYKDILQAMRIIELVGLSVSFVSVCLSLLIFLIFKSLYCSRTKIHIHLLLAIFIQIIARIVNYGIQMTQSNSSPNPQTMPCGLNGTLHSSQTSSVLFNLCPLIVIFLQFGISSMFMWMLCEGIRLNNVLTVGVFKNIFKTFYFYILGWVVPLLITLTWSILMFIKERHRKCWSNYNYLKYYWIIDGPRYAVMILNFLFLLNIIRVLMKKIKEGSENQVHEEKQRRGSINTKFVKKAVKAAIFLLPLLGATHMLETFVSPGHQSIPLLAVYCTITYFLVSFQGFFCALLYCFLNTEVRETISRRVQSSEVWANWKRYLGKKERYRDGQVHSDDRTRSEFLIPQSSPNSKKSDFELMEQRLTTDTDGIHLSPRTISS